MFGRLFGSKSSILPTPPRHLIEVVCPSCGAAQYEPRLVVSTFCKKCGVHLSIHRRKVSASNVTRSGAGMDAWQGAAEPTPAPTTPPAPQAATPPPAVPQQTCAPEAPVPADQPPAACDAEPARVPTLQPAPTANVARSSFINSLRRPQSRPQSNSPPPTPAPAPQTPSSLQKMKEQGIYRNQYFKDVECFEYGHKFKTSRSARSANCPACNVHISIEDVEINMPSNQAVKTRGNVLVRKRGRLSTPSVLCRDLDCHGLLEANVTCSGDATFRTTGRIVGEIRCNRFVIEKGADVAFQNSIHATEVEIQARITGTIFCSGSVVIGHHGSVNGDVTARSVSIEPGGELNGAMNIVRHKPAPPPAASV